MLIIDDREPVEAFGFKEGDYVLVNLEKGKVTSIEKFDPGCVCEDCEYEFLLSERDWIDKTCPNCGSANWNRK